MKDTNYIPALGYDFLTPFYDGVVGLTTREKTFKRALIEQAQIEPNHRVLDLACGTGTLTILAKQSQKNAEIVGVDGDPKILEIARRKTEKLGLSISFDTAMSYDLPYPDHSFDTVISSLFFHHLTQENKLKTFREVKRILKPNGKFHLADWGLPTNLPMKFASKFIQMLDGKETTEDNFSGRLAQLIEKANFANIQETKSFDTLFGTIRLIEAENK